MKSLLPYLALALVDSVLSEIVYLTDLPAFKQLLPCVATKVRDNFGVLTSVYSECPPTDATDLARCLCKQVKSVESLSLPTYPSLLYACGSSRSEDIASGAAILSIYCSQVPTGQPVPAVTNSVTEYIADLPAYWDLAPCASIVFSSLVVSLSTYKCSGAAPAFASCACLKNQNSLSISGEIDKSVSSACGTNHPQDVSSVQAVFAGYCGLLNGTSKFPVATPLAGSVSYYVTDLVEYSALASCAKSAVWDAAHYSLTSRNCPKSPLAFASCACAKDSNSASISTAIISQVRSYCSGIATEEVTSALALFGLYCSAASGLVTPKGIKVPPAKTTGRSKGSSTSGAAGAAQTGADTNYNADTTALRKKEIPIAAIAGIGVGCTIFAMAAGAAILKYRRNRLNKPPSEPEHGDDFGGKAELASTSVSPLPQKSEIFDKPPLSPDVPPTQETPSEMAVPAAAYPAEAPGTMDPAPILPPNHQAPELGNSTGNAIEMNGTTLEPRHEMPGVNTNNGPYYEMPGSSGWAR